MIAGDFFKGNLPKADCYILTYVLHDWSDEQVNVILRHVSEALPEGKNKLQNADYHCYKHILPTI